MLVHKEHASELPRGLVKTNCWAIPPEFLIHLGLGGARGFASNMIPGDACDAAAAGPGTTL